MARDRGREILRKIHERVIGREKLRVVTTFCPCSSTIGKIFIGSK